MVKQRRGRDSRSARLGMVLLCLPPCAGRSTCAREAFVEGTGQKLWNLRTSEYERTNAPASRLLDISLSSRCVLAGSVSLPDPCLTRGNHRSRAEQMNVSEMNVLATKVKPLHPQHDLGHAFQTQEHVIERIF